MNIWRHALFFLLVYFIALVITAPAALLVRALPAQIQAEDAEGSFWAGSLQRLRWQHLDLHRVTWRWQWGYGLPTIRLTAQGNVGQGAVTLGWNGGWQLSNGRWQASAQKALTLIDMPLPFHGEGELRLTLDRLRFDSAGCQQLKAALAWREAALVMNAQRAVAGEPKLTFSCQPQRLIFALQEPHRLHASGQGSVDRAGNYRFSGRLRAPADLPAQ
ncbi:type II secretion system protein N [Mixta intestinalis]|uniref:Type II secretion system protein N n=1 Tax=Mixta intestinalis TaxID=1615494 RepID=A0A6P1PWS7_9GAMM|nr:type II secretion system protein N [Mixta intestinalis]QHM70215.1 Type II secretion system protein N [Mixta intestinalis]